MTLEDASTLEVRGYVGLPGLGLGLLNMLRHDVYQMYLMSQTGHEEGVDTGSAANVEHTAEGSRINLLDELLGPGFRVEPIPRGRLAWSYDVPAATLEETLARLGARLFGGPGSAGEV